MTQINLTAEQAKLLSEAEDRVAICRPDGIVIGWVSPQSQFVIPAECPFTPEEIAAAESDAESGAQFYTTKEVLDHLRSLQ